MNPDLGDKTKLPENVEIMILSVRGAKISRAFVKSVSSHLVGKQRRDEIQRTESPHLARVKLNDSSCNSSRTETGIPVAITATTLPKEEPTITEEGTLSHCTHVQDPLNYPAASHPRSRGAHRKAPLFTDATMDVACQNDFQENVFEMDIPKQPYHPFEGLMKCKDNQVITGIDLCFEGELKYVAIECNTINQYKFELEGKIEASGNSETDPANANCPQKKALVSLKLSKNDNGKISVEIGCDKIVRK
ncbi:hypothetical protein AVEN_74546-1 [Araneus ventricosus]|uniref:Uncharacterized protein n=1 Tax=Araneus ventricosus TaxID=182803 RepID=A0A4Y2GNV7_ARAVE|nr:hypothetical protein AVEN_74546-1 [Araneus ventricosus]